MGDLSCQDGRGCRTIVVTSRAHREPAVPRTASESWPRETLPTAQVDMGGRSRLHSVEEVRQAG